MVEKEEKHEGIVKRLVVGIGEAALMLDVSRSTIERMLNRQELGYVIIGGKRKIPLYSIYQKVGMNGYQEKTICKSED